MKGAQWIIHCGTLFVSRPHFRCERCLFHSQANFCISQVEQILFRQIASSSRSTLSLQPASVCAKDVRRKSRKRLSMRPSAAYARGTSPNVSIVSGTPPPSITAKCFRRMRAGWQQNLMPNESSSPSTPSTLNNGMPRNGGPWCWRAPCVCCVYLAYGVPRRLLGCARWAVAWLGLGGIGKGPLHSSWECKVSLAPSRSSQPLPMGC